jgi:EAL domain-containing protein (putative c-di-GMP-specific phosphodiesterase class I)
VAYFRQDDKRSEIFARGDLATESARHAGHDGLVILPEQPDDKTALGSFGWRMLIQNALKENRWRLMAQPVVDLAERGRMLHGEMMARLVDGEGNLVPASQFLPMAVRHDLMPDIDRGLVSLALDYLRRQTDADKRIAINLSPQSVANAEFVAWLGARLAELKADARRLLLEISEFGCLRNVAAASEVMALARRHGARFGIDHFGLDPQSLRLMREMPPDYVKLNGGLVGAMATDEDARAVVESIVQLAHSLEVQVIAQNVEDEAQVGVLLAVAVDGGQGYLFGAPI